ncbi:MAG: ribonuclease P protein component [Patescibacteria group bacterium]|nr:ribonuclease P protein component [Patescibacteria group bacterium]
MLPKTKRLNLSTDFNWVRSGKSIFAPHFKLFLRSGDNKVAKVGVAISSKNFPKATMRNKAKRVMFAAFEEAYEDLPKNLNIIALPKQGVDKVKSEDLKKEINQALKEIIK